MSTDAVVEALNADQAGPARTAHMIAAVLLDYPDAAFAQQIPVIRGELEALDEQVADEFQAFLDWAEQLSLDQIEAAYVDTFDRRRKCSLYLSYYTTGDTRQRGMALVTFQQAFEAAGWRVAQGELPDYLPAVLELSARTGDELAQHLLGVNREGLEVLREALESLDSPWASVMRAVLATLGPIDDRAAAAFRKLVMEGPPSELVGIQDLPFPVTKESAR